VKRLLNPLAWPLAKSFFLIGFTVATIRVAYIPYTPGYDAHYRGQSFASASVRASALLAGCLLLSYVLHTRRLVRTQPTGAVAYTLMLLFYAFMLLVLAVIYFSGPRGEIGTVPFWK